MKIKIILILLVTTAIATTILLYKTGVIGNSRVSIVEETPNIVEAVEQIQELCTEYYYDEVTAQKQVEKKGVNAAATNVVNTTTQWFTNLFSKKSDTLAQPSQLVSKLEKELVVIAKVTCRVGYDLKEIMANDGMQVNGDTLFIDFPSPKFLETIVNPTDLDIFAESGSWNFPDDLKTVVDWAKETVENRAINDSIFEKADKSGRKILSNLFSTMGFIVIYNTPKDEKISTQTP